VFFRLPNLLDSITWFVSSVSSTSPAATDAAAKTFCLGALLIVFLQEFEQAKGRIVDAGSILDCSSGLIADASRLAVEPNQNVGI